MTWRRTYWKNDVDPFFPIPEHIMKLLKKKFMDDDWHEVVWTDQGKLWIDGVEIIPVNNTRVNNRE